MFSNLILGCLANLIFTSEEKEKKKLRGDFQKILITQLRSTSPLPEREKGGKMRHPGNEGENYQQDKEFVNQKRFDSCSGVCNFLPRYNWVRIRVEEAKREVLNAVVNDNYWFLTQFSN